MAGFRPDEGNLVSLEILLKRILTDRDVDLELGLFTNVAPGQSITLAAITEPSGTGYARKGLTDATWSATNPMTYPQQVFTAGAGGWTGAVQGYFIATQAAGGTPRLLAIEVDSNGPYTFTESDFYNIDLSLTGA
jgi:hypothetical protein